MKRSNSAIFLLLILTGCLFGNITYAYDPVPGPDFEGCRLLNYGSDPYAPLPLFNLLEYGGPVLYWPLGYYDFCAYMDTIYCSLPIVESQLNNPEITKFAELIICHSCDLNGPLDYGEDPPVTPSGILDGQYELGVLASILNDTSHPMHTSATYAFKYNFRVIKDWFILAFSNNDGVDLRDMLILMPLILWVRCLPYLPAIV